jgi:hypothetical protein
MQPWVSGIIGGFDITCEARLSASIEMPGPLNAAPFDCAFSTLVVGCTESTNSMIFRTPLGRRARDDNSKTKYGRSHGFTLSGWIRLVRAGSKVNADVLTLLSSEHSEMPKGNHKPFKKSLQLGYFGLSGFF